uniref:Uncharacterized protein n=2 Tax=Panagrolaimus TaxID=55784 RepID=A0A914PNC9_9BILA
MRRAEPDCAAKVHGNPDAVNTVVDIFTSTKKSAPILNYLNNVDQEFKEVYEDCGTEDYFQEPKTDVMGDMAQADRALCPFTTYLDVDPKRIPKAITKVKCLCNRPKKGKFGETINTISCEKVFYEMTVLKFSESCGSYKEETEKLVLACIPVFGSHRTIDPNVSKAKVETAPIQV